MADIDLAQRPIDAKVLSRAMRGALATCLRLAIAGKGHMTPPEIFTAAAQQARTQVRVLGESPTAASYARALLFLERHAAQATDADVDALV